ncbi:MAG: transcriptional repressor LexA [Calditrichaeota bacterium]|nr:transcriptional repressor LexA [Candidatus Cloacimonadota bacterium]MCA9786267.1 transcriptional repressor LexA [Candidatus Cloacimonadota bacterium]MCB1046887.1 transcriptional repressor LexA [Calditrichota bacterium]MCB9472707.1 transcriptional repressor LexA [Candidatus Delongbacteria bacterium]
MSSFNRNLTSRQEDVLRYLREQLESRGAPPSYRELGEHFDIRSTNGVKALLDALESKGYLQRRANKARSLELTMEAMALTEGSDSHAIPLLGRVAAGEPILATGNLERYVQVDSELIDHRDSFALHVRGDSMIGAGILDGDLVIARSQESAMTGDMVVAILDEEATVKFYFPEGERVRLQPANERYEPILVDRRSPEFRIAGKVIGLMRSY